MLLYNEAAKNAPLEQRAGMLAEPVKEGRELFAARAAPTHLSIFDQTVEELIARPLGLELRALLSKPVVGAPPPPRIGAPMAESSSATPVIIGVMLLMLAAAAAFFLFV